MSVKKFVSIESWALRQLLVHWIMVAIMVAANCQRVRSLSMIRPMLQRHSMHLGQHFHRTGSDGWINDEKVILRSSSTTNIGSNLPFKCFVLSSSTAASLWSRSRLFSASSDENSISNGKKRVVFLGTPDVAATCLQTIYDVSKQPESCYDVVAVVTQPPKRRKRKGKPEASPVGKIAEGLGITVLCPEKARDPDFLQSLEEVKPDLCITAAYGQYLPKRFLATPPYGTVNIHPSLLPKWRGASPVQRSLEAGENPLGVTVLYTVSKMDAGPIIEQKEQMVDENAMATEILPMLFELGTELLIEKVPDILSGKITTETATEQKDEDATQASMIDASEAEFKVWEENARTCHNRLRGFAYWPQAFIYVQVGKQIEPIKLKIIETRVVDDKPNSSEVTDIIRLGPTKKDGLYLTCGDGSILELVTVQPATRKAFPARDFQNGYPGETLRWVKSPVPAAVIT